MGDSVVSLESDCESLSLLVRLSALESKFFLESFKKDGLAG